MSTTRAESQYGRRRSDTAQSILRSIPSSPLKIGDSKVLNLWVHESGNVLFNQSWWPGVVEGDMLRATSCNSDGASGFLFVVPKDDGGVKPMLQISVPHHIAETFNLRNFGEVTVTKVDKDKWSADYVEVIFQDQYLGRNDMWRLGRHVVGHCVYTGQDISFIGAIAATIQSITIGGEKVSAAYLTSSTKIIYRSLSARVTIFIQVCQELWDFAGDGERYNEKIVHSFLPALFSKWQEAGTNHTVTIVLVSRVYYDQSETDYAAGPLQCDEEGKWYKDFYKVITDLEVIYEWKQTLVDLKNSFGDFQRDILLTHHYHRAKLDHNIVPSEEVRLVGRLSFAHEGPILEALNLGLNPTETHYIDRSLSMTGASTIMISPGTGYFCVSKQLLRLTTIRMLDQGFGVDLICLTNPPLHRCPILCFQGIEPELRMDLEGNNGIFSLDPLWGGDDNANESVGREKTTFWWDPFWMSVSFWDRQMDLPFRHDRFIARAKMHEIQMLGLLERDVLSDIAIPFLPDPTSDSPPGEHNVLSAFEARKFDLDTFTLKNDLKPPISNRASFSSSTSGTVMASSYRSLNERRTFNRDSTVSSKITPIEESPRQDVKDLPIVADPLHMEGKLLVPRPPSQSGTSSLRSSSPATSTSSRVREPIAPKPSLASKFAPSWLLKPFRSLPQVGSQTTFVSAPTPPTPIPTPSPVVSRPSSPIRMPSVSKPSNPPLSRLPKPMAIKKAPSNRSVLGRNYDEEPLPSHRAHYFRRSPMNTPPRDDPFFAKRRSGALGSLSMFPSSYTTAHTNPSRARTFVSYTEYSLANRWQHMFPHVAYKHEIKWRSIVTPGCLPLTVEHFPTASELDSFYDVSSWHFVVDPREMRSFLVKPPTVKGSPDEIRRAWALVVMQGMAAVRLAQGFQFVLKSSKGVDVEDKSFFRRSKSFLIDDLLPPKPVGAAEVLATTIDPVYLSMSNEIHQISYTGDAIQVRRYIRRMPPTRPFDYRCLIWPKLGIGYTELTCSFTAQSPEHYGWNRLDMLIAGYEHQFNESLRYWRTRFVVIPAAELPSIDVGPSGESLDEEEARLLGIEKLAEIFTRLRWRPTEERSIPITPVQFLPTTLGPAMSVLDEGIVAQLDEIHAAGPLRKKAKSEREIGEMSLSAIAKAMREEDSVRIKNHKWHTATYPDSFTGFDFVSWLVREFRDVSSRTQGAECGIKLLGQGLFEHCRGQHGFLDGHYFYRLKGDYAVPMTPRGWFRSRREGEDTPRTSASSVTRPSNSSPRRHRRRLILSQTTVIDVDPNKRSDQAETVILHHDIMHNPNTVFHFELHWIGTTARCIDDQLRQWSRSIERYGIKLVEAYVSQICDIRDRNAFQSCFPIRLVVPPPIVPDLDKRIPENVNAMGYFEDLLLRRFNFVLDVEAADAYPEQVDVVYSYRRSAHKYSQYVHRTGVAFVQVLGGCDGFLYLMNRLIGPGRMGTALRGKDYRPSVTAVEIMDEMRAFCSDETRLATFYEEELAKLGAALPEEPPPLSI